MGRTRKAVQRGGSEIHKCFEKYSSTQQDQTESSWQSTFSPTERNWAHSAMTAYRMAAAPVTRFFWRVKAKMCSSPPSQQVCGVAGTELRLARKRPPPALDLVVTCSRHRSELWAQGQEWRDAILAQTERRCLALTTPEHSIATLSSDCSACEWKEVRYICAFSFGLDVSYQTGLSVQTRWGQSSCS